MQSIARAQGKSIPSATVSIPSANPRIELNDLKIQGNATPGFVSRIPRRIPSVSQAPVSQGPVSSIPVKQGSVSRIKVVNGPVSKVTQAQVSRTPLSQGSVSRNPLSQGSVSRIPVKQVSSNPAAHAPVIQVAVKHLSVNPIAIKQNNVNQTTVKQVTTSATKQNNGSQGTVKSTSSVNKSSIFKSPIGPFVETAFRLIEESRKIAAEADKRFEEKFGRSPYEGDLAYLKPNYSCFGLIDSGRPPKEQIPLFPGGCAPPEKYAHINHIDDDTKDKDLESKEWYKKYIDPYVIKKDDLVMQPGPMLEDETFDESVNVDVLDDEKVFPKRTYLNMYCLITGRRHIDDEVMNERINVDALIDDFLDEQ